MKVKIWIENSRYLRADVIKANGKMGRNLYHLSFRGDLITQTKEMKDRVIFDHPNEKEIEFV